MAPPPNLEAFNAPSREVCTVRRERTNTPLQALVTLNDPQFVEASRRLAERALGEQGDDAATLQFIALRMLGRKLTTDEQAILIGAKQEFLRHYQAHPDDARALIAVGESTANPDLDAATLAAWSMVSSQLLNLDEALNK